MKLRHLLVPLLALSLRAVAEPADDDDAPAAFTPAEPSCFGDKVRVSALISSGDKVKVGIVETATKASYLVSPGEQAGPVEVISVDYDREIVTLKMGEQICTLNLAGDPNAPQYAPQAAKPAENVYRGEAIESFLRENPNAVEQGMVKFPLPVMPDAVGKGEGIEQFLRDNPEAAATADKTAEGKGESIESFLKAHPEIKVDEEIKPGSFGSGIDAELKRLGINPQTLEPVPGSELIAP